MAWEGALSAGINATNGLVGNIFGWYMNKYNNEQAALRAETDRRENYQYNEMAADAADARTRALYSDLYSPEAQMRQIKTAGLSPSMMAGGLAPGAGGASGAQGNGTAGVQTPYYGFDPMTGAQMAKILAETNLISAETKKTNAETTMQDLQNDFQEMANTLQLDEFQILQRGVTNSDGTQTSFNEIAMNYDNFEEFLAKVREISDFGSKETHVEALRKIFKNSRLIGRDIAILSDEKVSAEFDRNLIDTLKNQDFINLSAEEAVSQLRKNISVNQLTEYQKDAWNNLLDRIGKKNETARDILIVCGMILNQALSNYGSIDLGHKTTNVLHTHTRGKNN